jgi:mono/diheme cytochrome c family protein
MVPKSCKELNVPGGKSARRRASALNFRAITCWAAACLAGWNVSAQRAFAADKPVLPRYTEDVQPILEQYCYGCHGLGTKKGGVALDEFDDAKAAQGAPKLWHSVLKNLRSGIMPPAEKPQPSAGERRLLEDWIKRGALGIDPTDPDPGRVTVRRLNRIEYRNTIRDLIGVDYDASSEFPPDDTGNGFDNNGDVLTLSPLLLEKYLSAANSIVSRAVPMVPKAAAIRVIPGQTFKRESSDKGDAGPISLSYYEPSTATSTVIVENGGRYRLILDLKATEKYVDGQNDYNRCRLLFFADGEELVRREFLRQDNKPFRFEFDRDWKAGTHTLMVQVQPLTPDQKRVRSLSIGIQSVTLRGPMDERYWVRPPDYARYFPGEIPEDAAGRRIYTREILGRFAERAFRRPVDDVTKDRLAAMAEAVSARGQTFEAGVAQAMAAVLTSPRFLFREEGVEPGSTDRYPMVDEFALASRLSYLLWSSMPDALLYRLASEHNLRAQLRTQVDRMLADSRSAEFIRNFVGQWLQARDIDSVIINASAVMSRDQVPDPEAEKRRDRFRALNRKPPEELSEAEKKELQQARAAFFGSFRRFREFELTGDLRRAMRRETEMYFEHVVRQDRPLVELLDSDYTFLNQRLAKHYGVEGIEGDSMRLVKLPATSHRGGILTQGTVLAVTSNPDRTSPVKRGLYILDNILGSPPAPPPPNIPSLEESGKKVAGRTPTLRDSMVLHRSQPSCAACHARMDPLGLALENFNALGRWRDKEGADAIDASGKLISGESFGGIGELKKILVDRHGREFYRCLTEKMLTYALGRGLEPYDVQAVDSIVHGIEAADGRSSALIAGIIESTPFQKRRQLTESHGTTLQGQTAVRASEPRKKGADHDD